MWESLLSITIIIGSVLLSKELITRENYFGAATSFCSAIWYVNDIMENSQQNQN
jgi:hypothetical protein